MTPREKAKEIYEKYGRKGSWNLFDTRMIDAIAAALTAYGEAEYLRGVQRTLCCCEVKKACVCRADGYARGVADSAKALIEDASVADKETKRIAKVWATMIRALARGK